MAYIGTPAVDRFTASKAASVYSGNGSTVAFTLEHAVGSDEDILVSVDGVIQEPSVAYAVSSGTTLTFTSAPSNNAGNNIFVYYLFSTLGTVAHPSTSALSATTGTFTGNVVIPNGGNIGSAGDTDAIAIASNGVVTFSQTPVNAGLASPFPTATTVTSGGGAATTNISQGLVKAWFNLNAIGTEAYRDTFNIGSVTDNAAGDFSHNFTNDMASANHATANSTNGSDNTTGVNSYNMYFEPTTTGADFTRSQNISSGGSGLDVGYVIGMVTGDLA